MEKRYTGSDNLRCLKMKYILNTYHPISSTVCGRQAIDRFGYHPLEDGSIRREPDFTSSFPGISGLCRPGKLNSLNIEEGTIFIYKTVGTHFLTAILEITHCLDNHSEARNWYDKNESPVPTNCILVPHLKISQSHGGGWREDALSTFELRREAERLWDLEYQKRGKHPQSSYYFITKPIYNAVKNISGELINIAPVLREHYGRIPNTEFRPREISSECFEQIILQI